MIPILFLLFLAALSFTTPGSLGFGLQHYHGHAALILILLPLALPLEPYFKSSRIVRKLESWSHTSYPHRFPFTRPTWRSLLWTPVLAPLIFYGLWIIRMRRFLPPPEGLGDSLLLLEHLPAHAIQLGYLGTFDEILALFWRSRIYHWLNNATGMSAPDAIGLISCIAGTLHALVIFLITDRLKLMRRLAAFALLFFVPAMQLYAGYVENYSFASFFLFLTVVAGIVQLERWKAERTVYPEFPALFAALGAAHHMILVFSLPALVLLVLILSSRSRTVDWKLFLQLAGRAALTGILVLGIVWYYFFFVISNPIELHKSFAFQPAIYPFNRIISIQHVKEGLNVLVLVAPAMVGLSGLWLPAPRIWMNQVWKFVRSLPRFIQQAKGKNAHRSDAADTSGSDKQNQNSENSGRELPNTVQESTGGHLTGKNNAISRWKSLVHSGKERALQYGEQYPSEAFALAVFLCFLGHSFIWNPVIGFPADWDLFSFYQGPLHVFLYLRIFVREEPFLFLWLRRVLLFTVLPSFLWISHNAKLTRESQFHISQAHRNLEQFLGLVQTESIFFRIPTLQRQRTYIEVRMFIVRAWNQIPYLRVPEQKKEELRQRLMQGLMRFQSLALQNRTVYEEQVPDVYYFLGDLNAEITELQRKK